MVLSTAETCNFLQAARAYYGTPTVSSPLSSSSPNTASRSSAFRSLPMSVAPAPSETSRTAAVAAAAAATELEAAALAAADAAAAAKAAAAGFKNIQAAATARQATENESLSGLRHSVSAVTPSGPGGSETVSVDGVRLSSSYIQSNVDHHGSSRRTGWDDFAAYIQSVAFDQSHGSQRHSANAQPEVATGPEQ